MARTIGICAALLVATAARAGDDLRCGGWIIKPGLTAERVLELCGEPAHTVAVSKEMKEIAKDGRETTRYESADLWLYDLDAGSFLRSVRLEQGKVRSVTTLGLRARVEHGSVAACATKLSAGDPVELIAYLCGEPSSREVTTDELVPFRKNPDSETKRRIRTETWTYPRGDKPLKITVRDDQLSAIDR